MLSNVYARNIFLSFKFSHLFLKINCLELFKGEIAKTAQHLNSYLTLFFFLVLSITIRKRRSARGERKGIVLDVSENNKNGRGEGYKVFILLPDSNLLVNILS